MMIFLHESLKNLAICFFVTKPRATPKIRSWYSESQIKNAPSKFDAKKTIAVIAAVRLFPSTKGWF